MNKKGFTLVELLSVIAIIAIVATIGIFSSIAIKKKMNKKVFDTTLTEIVASATTFANDNKEIFDESTVNQLINSQNKRVLGITLEDLRESKYEKGSDDTYLQYETKETINPLSIIIYEETSAGRMKACIEDSESNRNLIGDDVTHSEYGDLNIYCSEKAAFGGFTNITVTVENEDAWTKAKTMNIVMKNEGVNLAGFKVVKDKLSCKEDADWVDISGKSVTKTYDVNEELDTTGTTYYVCTKDSVGSINRAGKIVKMIDHTDPTCGTITGASTTWTKDDRTIKVGCDDNLSQCALDMVEKVFDTDTTVSDIEIADLAGNKSLCQVDVYVDKTKPTATLTVASKDANYGTNNVDISIEGEDELSGITKYCYTKTNSSTGCSWSDSNTFNNISTGKEYTSGGNVKYYAFTKDAAGNISDESSKDYSVYKSCTKTTETGNSAWGACSKSCGTGTQSQSIYYKDTYLGSTCPTGTVSQNCNTQDCCSSVTYQNGTTCSKTCGGGTYNRIAYSAYDGSRCASKDTSSGGASCNTQPCCSTGTYSYYECTADGYKRNRKWNECTNQYDYQTTTTACDSAATCGSYGSCSTTCGTGTKSRTCTYYSGGVKKTRTESTSCTSSSGCCDTGTYSYYDCTSNGYKRNRKWNECTNQYDYQTTTTACDSAATCGSYGACSTTCGTGTKSRTCTYYSGGVKKTRTESTSCTSSSGCCDTGTYSYYSCTSDGYERNRKWNECTGRYDYQTTTTPCASSCTYTYGSCSTSCGSGTERDTCTYYYGGVKKTKTETNSCYEDYGCCDTSYSDPINDYRYSSCTQVYITYCQDTCNSSAKCKSNSGSTYTRSSLKVSKPSSCSTSTSYTYNCKIRGNTLRSLSYSWDCTGGHKGHTTGYYIYCRRSDGTLKSAKDWKSSGVSVGATLVCPTNPYGTSSGWEVISG